MTNQNLTLFADLKAGASARFSYCRRLFSSFTWQEEELQVLSTHFATLGMTILKFHSVLSVSAG